MNRRYNTYQDDLDDAIIYHARKYSNGKHKSELKRVTKEMIMDWVRETEDPRIVMWLEKDGILDPQCESIANYIREVIAK